MLKSALDKTTVEYDAIIESLRKFIHTELPCSSDAPMMNSENNDNPLPPYQMTRVLYELAPHSIILRSEIEAMYHHHHHPNSQDHSAMQMAQLSPLFYLSHCGGYLMRSVSIGCA